VIFNENLCKVAEQYLKKGSKVFIEGQLQTRKWQDQSGQDRYSTEVVLQGFRGELALLDRAGGGSGGGDVVPDTEGDRSHSADPTPQATTAGVRRSSAEMDDEIPF
jgi:single-strand DNA-binding protein